MPGDEPVEKRVDELLVNTLRRLGGRATLGDAVRHTGLSSPAVRDGLRRLLDGYRGNLQVDESGELVYVFSPGMRRPWRQPLAERLRRGAARLASGSWLVFTFLYKVAIMATLLGYFLFFILLLVLAGIGASVATRDESPAELVFALIWGILEFMLDLFTWSTYWGSGPIAHRRKERKGLGERGLHEKIFAFVFGEPRPATDPLAPERRTLALVRQHRGRLSAADLVALDGKDLEACDRELTRLMIRHEGDVEVSEDGELVYTFDRLMPTTRDGSARVLPFWHQSEPLIPFNHNSSGTNLLAAGLNGFNLVMATGLCLLLAGDSLPVQLIELSFWGLAGVPLVFSGLFFLIPLVRWILVKRENRRIELRNAYRGPLASIMEDPGRPRLPEQLVPRVFERLVEDLGGEPGSDDAGHLVYTFPRLALQLRASAAARRALPAGAFDLGEVVYDSAD